jgi:hypothetical protein
MVKPWRDASASGADISSPSFKLLGDFKPMVSPLGFTLIKKSGFSETREISETNSRVVSLIFLQAKLRVPLGLE